LLDFNVLQGIIMLTIFAVLTANLIMDLIYPIIDPRVALT
jgi:peptide/nickel transport system permease protein